MSTIAYRCPCCGAALAYDGTSGKLACSSCGNSYEAEALEAMKPVSDGVGIQFNRPSEAFSEGETQDMREYICENCGAELLTEETTTSTECPYCGSPTILPERINGGVKPQLAVPFTISQEEAQKQFNDYFKGKLLLPNLFKNSRNRISEMRKLYVPYWLFDCEAQADIVYDAEKRHTERRGEWEIERVEHYVARRSGSMCFDSIPVDGSAKLDNRISESLEPYNLTAAVPFQPAVLVGAMADCADVNATECEGRAVERVETSMSSALRDTVNGYDSVQERSKSIQAQSGKITPVLMPVWLITTDKAGKTYTFAINGQTGKLTCDVPADKKKTLALGGGVFAGVFGICALVMYLLGQFASGTLLLAALAALILALIVVGILKGQLKQAVKQSAAANYIRKDSFQLHDRYDHFLYITTNRRKIENSKDEGEAKKA